MPFKSQAQRRKFCQFLVEGKISPGDLRGMEPRDRKQEAPRPCEARAAREARVVGQTPVSQAEDGREIQPEVETPVSGNNFFRLKAEATRQWR